MSSSREFPIVGREDQFVAIDQYLSLSKTAQDQEKAMVNLDQKVPQNQFLVSDGDIMFSDISTENRFASTMSEMLARDEFAPLEPIPSYGCIPVSEQMSDQQVNGSESPKSFMDLDTANGVSLYDECIQIKQEKVEHSDCYYEQCGQFQHQNPVPKEEPLQYIFEEVKNEVEHVCQILRISRDPKFWSVDDVRKWITWHGAKYCPDTSITDQFNMNGQHLCKLSVNEFTMRNPIAGNNLFAQLEIWRNACTLLYTEPAMQQTTEFRYPFDSFNDEYIKAEPPVSPSPSLTSEDSDSSANSPPYVPHGGSDDEFTTYHTPNEDVLPPVTEHKQTIHLWQFLKELLLRPESYGAFIKWVNRQEGIFKIEDSGRVAKLWGRRKNRPAMNYDKLSRSIRQYYKKGIIKKTTHSKRLVYQFCQPYL